MITQVKWQSGSSLNGLFLSRLEVEWNVTLPGDFKSVVLDNNYAYPLPNVFDTEKSKGRVFAGLLNFNLQDKSNAIKDYLAIKSRLPIKVYPFAEDPSGNFICFDFATPKPTVIFWNHEGRIVNGKDTYDVEFVADSFTDLLSKLYVSPFSKQDIDLSDFEVLP
ncbi:MAG TPA: SMI1/KNR4 family protein [Ohtaekwangia sp.]|uniref:SMI1/KNR4 family protein n=1 Tax=Ohtaekwangia sp. TaxID=2066019 RepID=UPI002F9556E3